MLYEAILRDDVSGTQSVVFSIVAVAFRPLPSGVAFLPSAGPDIHNEAPREPRST
jgi:hypothetical protein